MTDATPIQGDEQAAVEARLRSLPVTVDAHLLTRLAAHAEMHGLMVQMVGGNEDVADSAIEAAASASALIEAAINAEDAADAGYKVSSYAAA